MKNRTAPHNRGCGELMLAGFLGFAALVGGVATAAVHFFS